MDGIEVHSLVHEFTGYKHGNNVSKYWIKSEQKAAIGENLAISLDFHPVLP